MTNEDNKPKRRPRPPEPDTVLPDDSDMGGDGSRPGDSPSAPGRRARKRPPELDTVAPGLKTGMVLCGHYRLVEPIGSGGMGVAWLAEDTILAHKRALKFLPRELRNAPEARDSLQREAQTAVRLRHPSIVTLIGLESEDEYRDGLTLVLAVSPSVTIYRCAGPCQ